MRSFLPPAIILVGLVALNLLANSVFARADLTEVRGYSLAAPTLQALERIREPIAITAFLRASDYRAVIAEKLLGEYADRSKWITYEIVNPDVRPSAMQEKGVTRYGTLVFEAGLKRREISGVDEQSITNTLIRLTGDRRPVVYFTNGHGERDMDGEARDGYSILKWRLENDGYAVSTFALGAGGQLPDDASAIVVASPKVPIPPDAEKPLADYLLGGGKLIVLIDPGGSVPVPGLLANWGVKVWDDMVFDPGSAYFDDAATPLVNRFEPSPITRGMEGVNTFFPLSREVSEAETVPDGLQVTTLVKTSAQSWGEMDLKDPMASFDPKTDRQGPISLAVSVAGSLGAGRGADAAKARLVVIGNATFVSNAALSTTDTDPGNARLFTAALGWALEDASLVQLSQVDTGLRQLILTGQQMRWIGYGTMAFAPLLVALAGILVWWRRR